MCDSTGGEEGDDGKGSELQGNNQQTLQILGNFGYTIPSWFEVAIAVICRIVIQHNNEDLFEVEYSDQMTAKQAKLKKYWVDFMYTHSKIAL